MSSPTLGSKHKNLLFVLIPSCWSSDPHKALPEFFVWPLIDLYWLGKAKNFGQYHKWYNRAIKKVILNLSVEVCEENGGMKQEEEHGVELFRQRSILVKGGGGFGRGNWKKLPWALTSEAEGGHWEGRGQKNRAVPDNLRTPKPQGALLWCQVVESTCWCRKCGISPGCGRSPEKELATHSSILAWRIPWTEEPGGTV